MECWGQYFNDTDLRALWCDFMQQAYSRLKIANNGQQMKMASVWSSGLTQMPCLNAKNFAVQVWGGSQWSENYQLLDAGYSMIISHVDAWYLDCGFGNWRATGKLGSLLYSFQFFKHFYCRRSRVQPLPNVADCLQAPAMALHET